MFTRQKSLRWQFRCERISWRIFIFPVVLTLVNALTIPNAFAQRYETLSAKMGDKASKTLWRTAAQALNNPATYQTDKGEIDAFFMKYYFPKMTETNPNELGQLGKRREDLLKWLRGTKVPEAQQHLTGLTLKAMRVISRHNFHPAVRYNAALILGFLNNQYATAAQPPVPLPEGTLALIELMEESEFTIKGKTIKVPASVRVASLVGLQRHARFGITENNAPRVTKACLEIITSKEPREEITRSVHHWMKCMAARVLAHQHGKALPTDIQSALTGLIADNQMGLEDRCCAAEILDHISYAKAAALDGTDAVLTLGKLAQDVLEEEAKESEEFEQDAIKRGPGTNRGFGGRNNFELATPQYPRRRLLNRLTCITRGSNSLVHGLSDESKQNMQKLVDTLTPTMTQVANKKTGSLEVTGAVIELKSTVDTLVNSWKQPSTEATDEAPEDGEIDFAG